MDHATYNRNNWQLKMSHLKSTKSNFCVNQKQSECARLHFYNLFCYLHNMKYSKNNSHDFTSDLSYLGKEFFNCNKPRQMFVQCLSDLDLI